MKKLILIILVMFTACSIDEQDTSDPIFCSTDVVAGLEITVRSSATGEIIKDGIIVIVNDDIYIETLQNNNGNNDVYSGAFERQGAYTLRISGSDYQTYTATDVINVEADICHVLTERRDISIDPN